MTEGSGLVYALGSSSGFRPLVSDWVLVAGQEQERRHQRGAYNSGPGGRWWRAPGREGAEKRATADTVKCHPAPTEDRVCPSRSHSACSHVPRPARPMSGLHRGLKALSPCPDGGQLRIATPASDHITARCLPRPHIATLTPSQMRPQQMA